MGIVNVQDQQLNDNTRDRKGEMIFIYILLGTIFFFTISSNIIRIHQGISLNVNIYMCVQNQKNKKIRENGMCNNNKKNYTT